MYTNERPKKVGVVYGGFSHEANFSSTPSIIEELTKLEIDSVQIKYEDPEFLENLRHAHVDILFPQSLGAYGEDGTLQSILDYLNIAYVGSGVAASALCANKWLCSQFIRGLAAHDGRTDYSAPLSYTHTHLNPCKYDFLADQLGLPFLLKPMLGGASFGIEIIHNEAEFQKVLPVLEKEFEWMLAEQFIKGTEYCWGFIEDNTQTLSLPVITVKNNRELTIRSHNDKRSFSPNLQPLNEYEEEHKLAIEDVGKTISSGIGLRGFARMDIIVNEQGCAYILDINTLPGIMPKTSIYSYMCEKAGINQTQLISMLVSSANRPQLMRMRKLSNPPIKH